mmetsp:Transcript_40558/g.87045  ORF Transcript_40558/g.87045 Transcript_40558/m.87045 type:complete len:274 (-) Transcript_40558:396-1217(-)|eukprot:CAMPEP_0206494928 /NCGR_PEP_ID=MMETSP0324_2-20121206/48091_1 /ASSEMBLY_ACC=CAM_ASM_000836 /TAXON_ID=2866 /ORGANISM="Crypthecodinium cohnii, Strain Seligo" /LENGTH=273 /DNA_ID=CAMNT_0053978819 /DNA_START=35 /DNA_END=856 /DNA_ORIENTATION=+
MEQMLGETPYGYLLSHSEDDLRHRLLELESAVAQALQEVSHLETVPQPVLSRLDRLEKYFSDLRPGDTLRVVDPELKAEAEALKAELRLDVKAPELRRAHLETPDDDDAGGQLFSVEGNVIGHVQMRDQDLVMGTGYLPLDRNALHAAEATQERRQKYHPTVDSVHYAGNLERAAENVHALFVCPGNHLQHRPLEAEVHDGSRFWLEKPWRAPPGYSDDPPLFRSVHDSPPRIETSPTHSPTAPRKHDQEDLPVDWLGLKRRGVDIESMGAIP